jgi:Pvc16 N-terminal domain
MSAHFAIPATTFVLRAILEARLKAAYGTFTPPRVSIEPPQRPPAANGARAEGAGLILYLHHAGPNPAWRNMHEPRVDSAGDRVTDPPLVLDLHYMLAAQGADLEREAVLGVGMSAFHRNGVIGHKMIHAILNPIVPGSATLMDKVTGEPLDDPAHQPESITISQQPVDIDHSTKIWSALQSPHRPCAFYLVTTVFLDTGGEPKVGKEVERAQIFIRPTPDPVVDTGIEAPDAVVDKALP